MGTCSDAQGIGRCSRCDTLLNTKHCCLSTCKFFGSLISAVKSYINVSAISGNASCASVVYGRKCICGNGDLKFLFFVCAKFYSHKSSKFGIQNLILCAVNMHINLKYVFGFDCAFVYCLYADCNAVL